VHGTQAELLFVGVLYLTPDWPIEAGGEFVDEEGKNAATRPEGVNAGVNGRGWQSSDSLPPPPCHPVPWKSMHMDRFTWIVSSFTVVLT